MLCILIRTVSSGRFYWLHSTYHYMYFIEARKENYPYSSPDLALWSTLSALNYPYRKEFYGPKGVQAIEVRLYKYLTCVFACGTICRDSAVTLHQREIYICGSVRNHVQMLMSRIARKRFTWHVRPTKTQISLCIRAIWSVVRMKKLYTLGYPKCAQWRFWSNCANVKTGAHARCSALRKHAYSNI